MSTVKKSTCSWQYGGFVDPQVTYMVRIRPGRVSQRGCAISMRKPKPKTCRSAISWQWQWSAFDVKKTARAPSLDDEQWAMIAKRARAAWMVENED
jgi:hypothetical protein